MGRPALWTLEAADAETGSTCPLTSRGMCPNMTQTFEVLLLCFPAAQCRNSPSRPEPAMLELPLTTCCKASIDVRHIRCPGHSKCSINATEVALSQQGKHGVHGSGMRCHGEEVRTPQGSGWEDYGLSNPCRAGRLFKVLFCFHVAGGRFLPPTIVSKVCKH